MSAQAHYLTGVLTGTIIPHNFMTSLPSVTGEGASSQSGGHLDDYVQPTLSHGLRIWWALYWRTSLIGSVLVYFVAVWVGILTRNDVVSPEAGAVTVKASPYVLFFAVAFFIMRYVVRKRFRGFRIRLTAAGFSDTTQELPPTKMRTARIWWSYTWRCIIYVAIASFIANIPLSVILMAAAAVSRTVAQIAGFCLGLVLNGAVGLFVIYSNILDEDIGGFRVGLIRTDGQQSDPSSGRAGA